MFLKKFAFVMILLLIGTQVYSQTAEEILEKMGKELGKEYQTKIKTQKIEMNMAVMGMEMPMTMLATMPDKYRIEMSVMGMSIVTVVTPENCFMIQNGNVTDMPDEQCQQARGNMDEQNAFMAMGKIKENSKVELAGSEVVNGKDCYKIKITEPEGNIGYFYIGKSDYLMHKFTSKMQLGMGDEKDVEMLVTEYKVINNMKIPHVMTIMADGEEFGKMTIKSVEIDIPIDQAIYKKP